MKEEKEEKRGSDTFFNLTMIGKIVFSMTGQKKMKKEEEEEKEEKKEEEDEERRKEGEGNLIQR